MNLQRNLSRVSRKVQTDLCDEKMCLLREDVVREL